MNRVVDSSHPLIGLAERLATTTSRVEAARALAATGCDSFGAHASLAWLRSEEGYELVAVYAYDGERTLPYTVVPLDTDLPLTRAMRTARVVTVASRAALLAEFPYISQTGPVHHDGWAVVPFLEQGEAIGGLVLCFSDPPTFDGSAMRMLEALTAHARIVFERTASLEAEQHARRRAEASEQAYRDLADSLPHVVFAGRGERVDYLNEAWLRLTGTSVAEGLGTAWTRRIHPEDLPLLQNAFARHTPVELRLKASDETWRWHELRLTLGVGRETFTGVAVDIHDRRAAELQLALAARASVELARTLDFESTIAAVMDLLHPELADFGFFDLVHDGQVRRVARAWDDARRAAILEPSRWARSEHPELNLCALSSGTSAYHPDVDDAWMKRAASSPEHLAVLRALGFCSMVSVPLRRDREVIGALTLFYADSGRRHAPADVALIEEIARRAAAAIENARLYGEARRLQVEAEEANRVKDDFLAMLGHELRNPLAPIVTAMSLIDLRAGAAFERERQIVGRQLTHLVRLVDDLLDVSRITNGKLGLRRGRVILQEVVATALDMTRPLAEERRHRVRFDDRHGRPCHVDGDSDRLTQVLSNLLINAARYTPPGGNIDVTLAVDDDAAEITIADDGVGMATELIDRAFEPFHQGERSGGLGLGLAIARQLVDLHGGIIAGESDGTGRGTTFRVRLPIVAAEVAEVFEPSVALTGRERRILLVDDNEDAAVLLGEYLAHTGHDVRVCFDPLEALKLVATFVPDVAVLDIGMPSMDGYELAARLRALPSMQGARLVAVTGYGQPSDRERALAAGFDAHLVKPLALHLLQDTIVRLTSA